MVIDKKKQSDKELSRNGSGYYDPTAYKAMKRVEADEKRYGKEGRIVLTDKKTGKVWK